ncbi:MAG: YbbR-like domain-containing protein [bacterium]
MAPKVFDNYKVKLVTFILAIFIWFFVVTENDYEYVIAVSVTPVNIPSGKVILNELPKAVKVKIKGTGKDLIALMVRRGARLNLDLSGTEHSKTFRLEPTSVFLSRPSGLIKTTEIIMPDSISVVLDDFQNKKIPVRLEIQAKAAPGYTRVGEIQVTPDSVVVSGPKSILADISAIPTQAIEFNGLTDDLNETVMLEQPDSERLALSANEVKVSLDIQRLVELTFSGIVVEVRNAPKNINVYPRPSRLSLVVEGGGELLAQMTVNDIRAYLDYNRIKNAPGIEHTAVIKTPPGIRIRNAEPQKFKLVFENN